MNQSNDPRKPSRFSQKESSPVSIIAVSIFAVLIGVNVLFTGSANIGGDSYYAYWVHGMAAYAVGLGLVGTGVYGTFYAWRMRKQRLEKGERKNGRG